MPARTWRDADPRGGHGPPPASVAGVVRHAHLALAVARWGESVLFLAAGSCVTLAAAALSGVALGRFDTWIIALFGGLCAGAGWGIAHFERPLEVARELDRRLRHQGGLITAYELERGQVATPMAALVIRRERARLRAREAVRVMFPSLALPVAAPLVGAALLALALQSTRPELPAGLDLSSLAAGMVGAVGTAYEDALSADGSGSLDGRTAREVMSAVNEIRTLERLASTLQERPEEARSRLEALDEKLRELTPRLARHPELAAEIDAARNWLDAARMALSPPTSAGIASERGEPLAAGARDGTMSSSAGGVGGESTPTAPIPGDPVGGEGATAASRPVGPPAAEAGTTAESWWPREYDGIVAGWIELRRRDPEAPGR